MQIYAIIISLPDAVTNTHGVCGVCHHTLQSDQEIHGIFPYILLWHEIMPTLHKAYIHSMHDSPISSVCANAIAFKYVLANVFEKKNVYTMHTIFFSFSLTSICIISRLKVVVRRVNVFLTTWICANASDNKIGSIEDSAHVPELSRMPPPVQAFYVLFIVQWRSIHNQQILHIHHL